MTSYRRSCGVLLHPTSLPSDFGIGDLGPWSYKFVDMLLEAKQHYWSMLPLAPTNLDDGNSPYQAGSSFAGNTLLISPELLIKNGLISQEYATNRLMMPQGKVNYERVSVAKRDMIRKAYEVSDKAAGGKLESRDADFEKFCSKNSEWLDDYVLYKALKEKSRAPWFLWSRPLRDREKEAVAEKKRRMSKTLEREKFAQFLFFKQFQSLKDYCHKKEISIFGDMPFYVSLDSADVWSQPDLFKMSPSKKPQFVGGVPPDLFSKTGQLWGSPVYKWRKLEETGFEWWIKRIRHSLDLFDVLRLDHFRGFVATWQVRGGAKTARKGRWVKAPSKTFLSVLKNSFPSLPFVAEDLGVITKRVKEARESLGVSGMRVLVFAFGGGRDNPHLPGNHPRNSTVYTTTHDTDTVRGWFVRESTDRQREDVFKCIGKRVSEEEISAEFIRLALASEAWLSIIPLQDILSLGTESRMNNPAERRGNWKWRAGREQLTNQRFVKLKEFTETFNRDT